MTSSYITKVLNIIYLIILTTLYIGSIIPGTFLSDYDYIIFVMFSLTIYVYVWYIYGFEKITNPIVLFMMYSFLMWFVPFLLIKHYSTFILNDYIYVYTVFGFSTLLIVYPFLVNKERVGARFYEGDLNHILILGVLGLLCSFIFTTLFFLKAGNIPMLDSNPEIARVKAMEGNGYIHRLSYISLSIGVLCMILYDQVIYKRIRTITIIILIILVAYNSLIGIRSQSLKILLQAYFFYMILKYGKINLKHLIILSTLLLFFTGFLGAIRGNKLGFEEGFFHLINRLFMNPINLQRIVEIFNFHDFMYGASLIKDFSVYLPGSQPNMGTILKEMSGAKFDGGGITVTLIGEGYLNFGVVGIFIYAVICAVIFAAFYKILTRNNKIYNIILLIIVNTSLMGFVSMGIFPVLSADTLPTIIIFIGFNFIAKLMSKNLKRKSFRIYIPSNSVK
jgi:oligosaccharide repeat unit polymerase